MSGSKIILATSFKKAHDDPRNDPDFLLSLRGYSLTTAEILYRIPDHLHLLQTYVWQDYDLFPKLPKLKSFLDHWEKKLDGPLFKVTVAHSQLIKPREIRGISEFGLN
jgi:uncharacterized protein Usg